MARAAKTWDPAGKWWEVGGGGSTWDGMAYDPELNLLYIGTDNGVPWARKVRSPAGGDNLFLASIVALEPDTGKYVWHYQVMPGDTSDYSAVQQITLADLVIDGKQRKVLLQAPKNGFVIVLDRTNGKFISARNYVDVNWATGYDKNGRPVETPLYGAGESPREIVPAPYGAHNWQAMSFNPGTGLLYIPAQNIPVGLVDNRNWQLGGPNLGEPNSNTGWNIATLPAEPKTRPFGRLVAWDPVKQKEVWRHEHVSPWNGGALTTAGNLVFQGTADARVLAFDARTGKQLWESPVGSGAMAPPVTYEVDGKQYVSIAVGWGGGYGLVNRHADRMSPGAVYTFALGGNAKPPEFVNVQQGALVSGVKYDPKDVEAGAALYISNCVMCHGFPGVDRGGGAPNMGYLDAAYIENLGAFLFKGPAMSRGMPDFTDRLKPEEVEKIKAFIQGTADSIRAASVKQ
jgi:quinohemoprotein ethanol dehydrogenase